MRLTTRDILGCPFCQSAGYLELLEKLAAYEDAEEQGLLVRLDRSMALAMLAGARAIEQNSRKYFGTTFVHDPFGCSKEITYFEAAKKLRAEAEAALKGDTEDVRRTCK